MSIIWHDFDLSRSNKESGFSPNFGVFVRRKEPTMKLDKDEKNILMNLIDKELEALADLLIEDPCPGEGYNIENSIKELSKIYTKIATSK